MYSYLPFLPNRASSKNFNAAVHENLLRAEAVVRRVVLSPKWLRYQLRRTAESYWPAFIRNNNRKPDWRIGADLVRHTMRWRCLPFHYLRYGLYDRSVTRADEGSILPETVMYYRVLPRTNRTCLLLDDKLVCKSLLSAHGIPQAPTVLWKANGALWTSEAERIVSPAELSEVLARAHGELVLKPASFGSGGRRIQIFRRVGGRHLSSDGVPLDWQLLAELPSKWLLEEYITAWPDIGAVHPASLNTFRVVTANSPGRDIEVVYCMLKFGADGHVTDNAHTDGVYVGVDLETGAIDATAFDENLRAHERHPTSGVAFAGRRVPQIAELCTVARRCAATVPELGLVGWDIAVDEDGRVLVIEGNSSPGLTIIQRTQGNLAQVVQQHWGRL